MTQDKARRHSEFVRLYGIFHPMPVSATPRLIVSDLGSPGVDYWPTPNAFSMAPMLLGDSKSRAASFVKSAISRAHDFPRTGPNFDGAEMRTLLDQFLKSQEPPARPVNFDGAEMRALDQFLKSQEPEAQEPPTRPVAVRTVIRTVPVAKPTDRKLLARAKFKAQCRARKVTRKRS